MFKLYKKDVKKATTLTKDTKNDTLQTQIAFAKG